MEETVYSIYVQGEFHESWEFEQDALDRIAQLEALFNNVVIKEEPIKKPEKNEFLEKADAQWQRNGLLTESAILVLNGLLMGQDVTATEIRKARDGLLLTLITDTPSGMVQSAIESMIQGRLEAGAEIHAGDFGYQEIPIEDYKPNPEWVARLSL